MIKLALYKLESHHLRTFELFFRDTSYISIAEVLCDKKYHSHPPYCPRKYLENFEVNLLRVHWKVFFNFLVNLPGSFCTFAKFMRITN